MNDRLRPDASEPFAAIDGEMAERVRRYDWAATALGPILHWPQSLKTAVGVVLLSPVPIVMLWGEDGIMIYNDAYSVFAGGRHPQLFGSKVREGWPEVADFNDNVMKVGLAGGTLAYRDQELTLYRTGKPEQVWMDLDYSPILDESGKPAGVMAIVVETTARVQAERARDGELERWRRIFEQAPSFICTLRGKEQIFDFVNAAHRRLFNSGDWVGSPLHEAFPDLAGQGYYEAIDRVFETGERLVFKSAPVRFRYTPDAAEEERLLDFIYEPIRDGTGRITGIFCEGFDVTEQRRTEDALRRNEEQLRLATDNAEIGLWDMDVLHNIAYSTPRVKAIFGMPADSDPAPDEFFELVHPDDIGRVQQAYAAAFDPVKRATYDIEYRVTGRDDGVLRWVHAKGRGVFDANGVLLRVTGTATDVTAAKQQQARDSLLAELGERLRLLENPDDISYAAAELLGRGLGVTRAGYGTIDTRAETITIARDWNAPGVKSLAGVLYFRDYGSYIDDLKQGRTVVFADAEKDRLGNAEGLKSIGAVSLVNMPVTEQAGLVAMLYLNNATPREWRDEELELIREVAKRTRVAVERRTAEAALKRSEEQLRLATEHADVGLWDVDVVNDRLYWPERVNMMFGFPPDAKVAMKQFRAGIHPDDRRRVVGAMLDACDPAKRAPYDIEYRIVRANDGAVRWVAVKGRAVFTEEGHCTRMLGIVLDITARKEIEEQAHESEARFRTLFKGIDDGFCIIEAIKEADGDGIADFRYIEENPALALRSGIVGALGHTIREMLPTEADGWIEILAKVLTSGEPMRFERFLETTGRLLELYVLRIEPRERNQVAVLFQDITDRRNAEMHLHEMNETLERRVIERTAALERSQAALQQAQKMEAIGNLTGGIAHDFNNLLQGVAGSLDLIRRKPDDAARVQHWAEMGLQAAERGARLTAQLLAFSRSQKLELKPLNVSTLLKGMRDLLGRTLGPSVRVALDISPDTDSVLGDETQLEMAVLNLAINARDAMPDGGDLTIATRKHILTNDPQLAAGDYIEIAVTDSGSGMPPEIAARAFDPFFTTKGVGKGTGLGLSQVYGMAQQARGIARIAPPSGMGATVSIFLRATKDAPADATRLEKTDAATTVPATILIVDDDPGVRRFLSDTLDTFGYIVLEAEDGPSCLELLARHTPDLMIVDYAMPGMTGAEVAQRARAQRPGLPIIFASGYAETAALENAAGDNMQILRKPFGVGELQHAMVKALGR